MEAEETRKREEENQTTRTLACREILSVFSVDATGCRELVVGVLIDVLDIVGISFRLVQSSESSQSRSALRLSIRC